MVRGCVPAVALSPNDEVMAPHVAPSKGYLYDAVQPRETRVGADEQPTPDRRLDVVEQDVQLMDRCPLDHRRAIVAQGWRSSGIPPAPERR